MATPQQPAAAALLQAALAAARVPAAVRRHGERLQAWNALLAFYRQRGGRPAWWDGAAVRPAGGRLLAVLDSLPADGLDARLYPRQELAALLAAAGRASLSGGGDVQPEVAARRVADLDLALSYTFLVAAAHLSIGRVQPPEVVHIGWHTRPAPVDLAACLQSALAGELEGNVAEALAAVAPHGAGYAALRRALAGYRDLAARGGWPAIPPGPPLRRGDSGPRVAALASRLAASGELPGGASAAPGAAAVFDDNLAEALSRFQLRHGLPPMPPATSVPPGPAAASPAAGLATAAGGPPVPATAPAAPAAPPLPAAAIRRPANPAVDAATLAALAVPVDRRIRQIELNLERWRWLRGEFGEFGGASRFIVVNLAGFQLHLVESGRTVLAMRVIVGRAQRARRTPVFSDLMTQIVLNPPWNVPAAIAAHEIASKLLPDGAYLRREDMEVVRLRDGAVADPSALGAAELRAIGSPGSPFRLRQRAGPKSALGKFKFVVHDQFDIYLHDTPGTALFARSERDFSHGCIRLEKPAELAGHLLSDDPRWPPEAIAAAVATGRTMTIPLAHPLPVHIVYQTAWVDDDGTLELRPDVYGHDAWLDAALAAETPLWDDLVAAGWVHAVAPGAGR